MDTDSNGVLSSSEIFAALVKTSQEESDLDGASDEEKARFYREHPFEQRLKFVALMDALEAKFPDIQAYATKGPTYAAEQGFEGITMPELALIARPLELAERAKSDTIADADNIVGGYWTASGASMAVKRKLGRLGEKIDEMPQASCFPPATAKAAAEKPWTGADVPKGLLDRCDIPKEDNSLRPEEFRDRYFQPGLPVLIKTSFAPVAPKL